MYAVVSPRVVFDTWCNRQSETNQRRSGSTSPSSLRYLYSRVGVWCVLGVSAQRVARQRVAAEKRHAMSALQFIVGASASAAALLVLSSSWFRRRQQVLPTRPEILLFGDSITQFSFGPGGWGAMLADYYQRTADIRLRGFSGYNTRWSLRLLTRVFPANGVAPCLVTIFLGANDANCPPPLEGLPLSASRQHVPVDEYVSNLRQIVQAARSVGDGSARVLLITPPPVDEDSWKRNAIEKYGVPEAAPANRNLEFTRKYATACVALGAELGVPTVDLYAAFLAREDWPAASLLHDGLHPGPAGNGVIGKAVLAAIAKHYPELMPQSYEDHDETKLRMDAPDHKDVDIDDLDATFKAY